MGRQFGGFERGFFESDAQLQDSLKIPGNAAPADALLIASEAVEFALGYCGEAIVCLSSGDRSEFQSAFRRMAICMHNARDVIDAQKYLLCQASRSSPRSLDETFLSAHAAAAAICNRLALATMYVILGNWIGSDRDEEKALDRWRDFFEFGCSESLERLASTVAEELDGAFEEMDLSAFQAELKRECVDAIELLTARANGQNGDKSADRKPIEATSTAQPDDSWWNDVPPTPDKWHAVPFVGKKKDAARWYYDMSEEALEKASREGRVYIQKHHARSYSLFVKTEQAYTDLQRRYNSANTAENR